MGIGSSDYFGEHVLPVVNRSVESLPDVFSLSSSMRKSDKDPTKYVIETVRRRFESEHFEIYQEVLEDLHETYNIEMKMKSDKEKKPSLEEWTNKNKTMVCKYGITVGQVLEDFRILKIKTKKKDDWTSEDNEIMKQFNGRISKQIDNQEIRGHVKEVMDVLRNRNLFYQYFFLENGFNKFWDKRKVLRTGSSGDVYEKEHAKLMKKYASQKPVVQLILTNSDGDNQNSIYKFFVRLFTNYGANHAALQVGPFVVDWTNSEMTFPHDLRSKGITLRVPLKLPDDATYESIFTKVSEICVRYNNQVKYSLLNADAKHKNCQGFVDETIKYIQAKPTWREDGPIARFYQDAVNGSFGDSFFIRDGNNSKTTIHNLLELREFWEETSVFDIENLDRDEIKQVVKSIERCFHFRLASAEVRGNKEEINKICPDGNRSQIIEASDAQQQRDMGSQEVGVTKQLLLVSQLEPLISYSNAPSSDASRFSHTASTSQSSDSQVIRFQQLSLQDILVLYQNASELERIEDM